MENLLILILLVGIIISYIQTRNQNKKLRILMAFTAGLIRYTTNSNARIEKAEDVVGHYEYDKLLKNVADELGEDFWVNPFEKLVKNDRNLFHDEKMGNGGFNMMWWDLFDNILVKRGKPSEKEKSE